MKEAVFITGFSNWGKSTIIRDLFDRHNFAYGYSYNIVGRTTKFTVESHSNDDWWGPSWVTKVDFRLKQGRGVSDYLFTALCPTIDPTNNFVNLLCSPPFSSFNKLHIFLIEYKWEHHAKLIIDNIVKEGSKIPNVNFIIINADQNQNTTQTRTDAKMRQIRTELSILFP